MIRQQVQMKSSLCQELASTFLELAVRDTLSAWKQEHVRDG